MEIRAKKAKENSMDPLGRVCSDLHDLMFQHMSQKEVLHLSTVSPDWNFAISTSSVAMSKVPLKLRKLIRAEVPKKLKSMLKSHRQYNKLRIIISQEESAENISQIIKSLEKFSPWLKELDIINNRTSREISVPLGLTFPKLELLASTLPLNAFVNATKLKQLIYLCKNFKQEAIDWIQSQKRLEELIFCVNYNNFFEFNPIAPSGLKRLVLKRINNVSEKFAGTFNDFLKPICSTLTSLWLVFCHRKNLELIINEMPELKILISWQLSRDFHKLKLKSNKSIETFAIKTMQETGTTIDSP
jgi:hypothetical protein